MGGEGQVAILLRGDRHGRESQIKMTAERDAGNSNTEVYEVLQSLALSGQLHPLFFHPIASVDVLSQHTIGRTKPV